MAQYHTAMMSVIHYGTVSNCRDISNKIWHNTTLSWYLWHIMGQYQIVLISLTKYGTIPYCHDVCDTLWHSIKLSW